MIYNNFANDCCRHFGYVLISGCESGSHYFCRCFVLNKTPFILDKDSSEYADLLGGFYHV